MGMVRSIVPTDFRRRGTFSMCLLWARCWECNRNPPRAPRLGDNPTVNGMYSDRTSSHVDWVIAETLVLFKGRDWN